MARRFNTQNTIETYIASQQSRIIDELMGAYPVDILLYLPQEDDEYDDVYGEDAGRDNEDEGIGMTVLFQIDSYHGSGFEDVGSFVEGHLYSSDPAIISGAHFKVVRTVPDGTNPSINIEELSARYEISESLVVGKTRIVEKKWKVKSLPH